ncbi:LOW QUALITY PROTEIN: hypothetical protein Cgig2_001752 [Carnegiea gigantea]|uniref:Reverse transcriptase domain-containing protein n=1 Tax=Carnegiea gigantea TaxID=171969 RepID=A0A9Q1KAQ0_9CARY|nr:LOW QUALITY PROTEIN: hypothetical protein Cgig2_001752 [Carnegiea gigantea]
MCLPRAVNRSIGVTPWRPPVAVRGRRRPLVLTETGGRKRSIAATDVQQSQPSPLHPMQCILYEQLGSKTKNRPRAPGEKSPNGGRLLSAFQPVSAPEVPFEKDHPMLKRLALMTSAPKPQNARKHCEFHEQHGHTIAECRELRKALHELADKGQIDRFLKQGPQFFGNYFWRRRRRHHPVCMEGLAARGPLLTVEQGSRVTVATMVFGGEQGPRYTFPHNDPLVVEMKCDCAKIPHRYRKLHGHHYIGLPKETNISGKGHHPASPPIPGLRGTRGKPIRNDSSSLMPWRQGKGKEYGVVDIPTAYNIIQGRSSLHKVTPLAGGRDELHLFGVLAFRPIPLTLFHIVDVSLKVVFLLEPCSSALAAFSASAAASTSASARAASTLESASLNLPCRSFFSASQFLPAAFVPGRNFLQPSALRHSLHCPSKGLQTNSRGINKIENIKLEKKEKEEYIPPTSVIATSSSVTLGGSKIPKAAKSHDLARSQTSSNLAAELAVRKFVECTRVPAGVSPTDSEAACAALGVPATSWGPGAWPPTDRSAERVGGDDLLTSFPLTEARVEAAASSRQSLIRGRLCLSAGGRLIAGFFPCDTRRVPTTKGES